MISFQNLSFANIEGKALLLDLYLPEGRYPVAPSPLVVWIHGGAFRTGDKYPCPALPLLEQGFAVASLNYRLSQQAHFPTQIHDCKPAIRWLRVHADAHNLDPQRIGVWGASAGGHLAALLGVTAGLSEMEGEVGEYLDQSSRVQAVCDWFGPTDFLRMNDFPDQMDHDAPDSPESELIGGPIQQHPERAAQANPVRYVNVTSNALPFLIMHGALDELVPLNQSELLYQALKQAGVPVTFQVIAGAGHGFDEAQFLPVVRSFFEQELKRQA